MNNLSALKRIAWQAIDSSKGQLHELSRFIWSNPEVFFTERKAHDKLTQFLETAGFDVERRYKLDTAFRARFGGGAGPHVAVLCEYDALPELGHACGHNLIAEAGIAAALGIKAAIDAAGGNIGQLSVLGTPAEEYGCGKGKLLSHGVFDDVDAAMMVHPASVTGARIRNLSSQSVKVTYRGKSSHAATAPWEGVNALDAAITCYQTVSVMRQQMKPTWRIHGIIANGGVQPNIIPELTELKYMIRAPSYREVNELMSKFKRCVEGAAVASGCSVDIENTEELYYELNVNQTLADSYDENAQALGIALTTDPAKLNSGRGGTDMGNVSHRVPSIHPWYDIGATFPAHTHAFADLAGSEAAQEPTIAQGKALAGVALDVLLKDGFLDRVKEEFRENENI